MKKKFQLSDDERALFRESVGRVRRLEHGRVVHDRQRPHPTPQQAGRDNEQVIHDLLSDEYFFPDVETGEEIWYARPGLQKRQLDKLRRGQFSVTGQLDLHGLTASEARQALLTFIHSCQHQGIRCTRIIHGKGRGSRFGKPILKNKVNNWLRQHDAILAFCSARPVDGGTGAIYVLIKTRK
jgi:DNA-nicking Smr family endonuclease